MQTMPFIHLRTHSAYSLAEGALPVKSLPKLCLQQQMPALGITDTNNLFGALEIAMACAEQGIQPITGCQITVQFSEVSIEAPLVVLAQNAQGYAHLLKLMSAFYLHKTSEEAPALPLQTLLQYADGLICLSGGHEGLLGKTLQRDSEKAQQLLQDLETAFQQRFYLELHRHELTEQKRLEPIFLEIALQRNLPIVATNDVYFDTAAMYTAHDALLCIAEGRYVSETNRRKVSPHHYFKSSDEMRALFADLPEAYENTSLIARQCSFMPSARKPILPRFPMLSNITEAEELRRQSKLGLEKRLIEEVFPLHPETVKETLQTQYQDRLLYELTIIEAMGFPGYFLIVSDFIKWAKEQGIPVGPGRGSGAGSLVAWVLTITNMDPIRFGLIFERFLNPERVSMPDFDVDFCQDRRDEVIQYVREKYGDDRVAHIITFGKLQARAVIRDVGRVLQMSYGQVDRICKLIPNNPANPVTLQQTLELEPALKQMKEADETVDTLITIGMQLEGLYRHASTHAAGVVIGDRPLDELVPLYKDDRSILPATQFNMKYAEAAGLVKFDFLGLKTLTVIEHCCKLIRHKGLDFQIDTIPLDDPATFDLLARVDVLGVFQVESGGMRDVLRKMRPDRFEDLIALVALFRPGPMDDIPRYLACKHGEEDVTYLHPALEPILAPTYGVMVYQEQVMKIAQELGGYTLGAADLLRRAMGKKIKSEMDAQRSLFVEGAIQKSVSAETASQIFDQMAKFAGYGFNKSHAAPYALLSYQTAYLKANHPLEFFAATMTYDMHNTDKLNAYRQDLEKSKTPLFPPNINYSFTNFAVEKNGIRYALAAIKNVGAQAMDQLVAEREKNGIFKDLSDFVRRMDAKSLNKRQLEHLIAAGALDEFGFSRAQLFEGVDVLLSEASLAAREKSSKQNSLFGDSKQIKTQALSLPSVREWHLVERLQKEFDALGFYLSAHPLQMYGDDLQQLRLTTPEEFQHYLQGQSASVAIAGIILTKQERTSKNGQKFAFVSLSHMNGTYEIAFFSEIFAQNRDLLQLGKAVYVEASLRVDGESYRLTAQSVQLLDDKLKTSACFKITEALDVTAFRDFMNQLSPGPTTLQFDFITPGDVCVRFILSKKYEFSGKERSQLLSFAGILQ